MSGSIYRQDASGEDAKSGGSIMESLEISDIASIPTSFLAKYKENTVTTAGMKGRPLPGQGYQTFQVLVTEVSGDLADCTATIQGSNIGGSSADVWEDISSDVAITATGSVFVTPTTNPGKHHFHRISIAVGTGSIKCFIVQAANPV